MGAIKYDYCYGFWPLERNSFSIILSHHIVTQKKVTVIVSLREYSLNYLIVRVAQSCIGDLVLLQRSSHQTARIALSSLYHKQRDFLVETVALRNEKAMPSQEGILASRSADNPHVGQALGSVRVSRAKHASLAPLHQGALRSLHPLDIQCLLGNDTALRVPGKTGTTGGWAGRPCTLSLAEGGL